MKIVDLLKLQTLSITIVSRSASIIHDILYSEHEIALLTVLQCKSFKYII